MLNSPTPCADVSGMTDQQSMTEAVRIAATSVRAAATFAGETGDRRPLHRAYDTWRTLVGRLDCRFDDTDLGYTRR